MRYLDKTGREVKSGDFIEQEGEKFYAFYSRAHKSILFSKVLDDKGDVISMCVGMTRWNKNLAVIL